MDGNNQYLIPANTKNGQLIAGLFYPIDSTILCIGLAVTFVALIVGLNCLLHLLQMNSAFGK